ncbi:MAG: NeuD/PglB/VioB family sugar acetyltransferase [Desulfobacterales bacterium]|nr:MAG: NeuD/PglB/VioB family sugar acetyltransferase [Desulfobacterales bacterium]
MKERKSKSCVILGGGGHAGALIDIIQASGIAGLHAILDRDSSKWGQDLLGVPILGDDDLLPELVNQGITHFVVGIGSTGNNRPRERLYQLGCSHKLKPLTIVHPGVFCSKRAAIGAGCQLLAGSIINAHATLGCNVIVNSGAIVEHDCVIGDHVHIATGAILASTVRVAKLAHIGPGATIRQLISIGESAVVGAGAVVVHDVPDHVVVGGVPARILERNKQ